jgi:hypothetical protein
MRVYLRGQLYRSINNEIQVRRIGVVGQCYGPVSFYLGAAGQFRGQQNTITEEGMSVQINHHIKSFMAIRFL